MNSPVENLFSDLRGHAKAARGVFDIDDREIDVVGFAYVADMLAHDAAPRAAEDVADEENVQKTAPGS